ncbi:hypothetical protein ONZ45_g3278 [Pleurotus djamor]|nr:hypothetical protein ONZ45_g15965 [Pleurotus djamor]KAJ8519840.1 hypothetical protein ONZ45_g3278 [Pleurotus djamor]
MPFARRWLTSVLLFAPLFNARLHRRAGMHNVTIDDETGDEASHVLPVYTPTTWAQGSRCPKCYPFDASQSHGGTWHDYTWMPTSNVPEGSVEFSFSGVSIYLFFSIVNHLPEYFYWKADYVIYIDGNYVFNYVHQPDPQDAREVLYQFLIYANETLDNRNHTLKLQANPNSVEPILLLFDYAEYTMLSDDPGEEITHTEAVPAATTSAAKTHLSIPSRSTKSHHVLASTTPPSVTSPSSTTDAALPQPPDEADPTTKQTFNVAAIIAGTLGGISFLMFVAIVYILVRPYCYVWENVFCRVVRDKESAEVGDSESVYSQ